MDYEKGKFQYAGLKFLYDTELIDDPQLINNMKLNVLDVSRCIRDVEFLSSYQHRAMLIYIDVNWIGRKFFEKRITTEVLDRVQQLLPRFRFRVVTDRKILELALARVEAALKGVTGGSLDKKPDRSIGVAAQLSPGGPELPTEPSVLQHHEAAAQDPAQVRDGPLERNQQVQQEVRDQPEVVGGDSNAGVKPGEYPPSGKSDS